MLDALAGPLAVAAVEVHHFGAVVGRLVVVVAAARVIDGVLLSKISLLSRLSYSKVGIMGRSTLQLRLRYSGERRHSYPK